VAKQAHGAVWMQYGETIVLVAVVPKRPAGTRQAPPRVSLRGLSTSNASS